MHARAQLLVAISLLLACIQLVCCDLGQLLGNTADPLGPAEALRAYVNAQRTLKCPALPLFTGTATLTHTALETAYTDIEVVLGTDAQALGTAAQVETYRASMLGGEILPATILPNPCDHEEHLSVTYHQIDAVNSQDLPWKSAMPLDMLRRVFSTKIHAVAQTHREQRRLLQVHVTDTEQQAPETTAQALETTAQALETTAQALETTAQALETTAQTAASEQTTTQRPATTTQRPHTTTQMPATTTPPRPPLTILNGVALPRDYDARDVYPGQAPCKGFQAVNQGATGA